MWPYSELGIEATADERAIKRAYAVRLKQNRPDENPQGFQRLHEAYQAALQRCRDGGARTHAPPRATPAALTAIEPVIAPSTQRTPPTTTTGSAPTTPNTPPAPAEQPVAPTGRRRAPAFNIPTSVPPTLPPFNVDAFLQQAVARGDAGDPALLRRWLESEQALWSISLKARTAQHWLSMVHQATPPMPEQCFDEMLAFFHLDQTGAVRDPLALAQRRQRMHLAWYFNPERRLALSGKLGARDAESRKVMLKLLRWLHSPFRWQQALLRSLLPKSVRMMNNLVLRLAGNPPIELPPPIDPRQQAFWLQAAQAGLFTRIGAAIVGARVLAALLGGLLVGTMFALFNISDTGHFGWPLVGFTMAMVGMLSAALIAWMAWAELIAWQRRRVPLAGRIGWLHFALVPAMTLGALVVVNASDTPASGAVLTLPAIWLALARLLPAGGRREGTRNWLGVLVLLAYPLAGLVVNTMEQPVLVGNCLAGAAMLAWIIDAGRRFLPFRRRAAA